MENDLAYITAALWQAPAVHMCMSASKRWLRGPLLVPCTLAHRLQDNWVMHLWEWSTPNWTPTEVRRPRCPC